MAEHAKVEFVRCNAPHPKMLGVTCEIMLVKDDPMSNFSHTHYGFHRVMSPEGYSIAYIGVHWDNEEAVI